MAITQIFGVDDSSTGQGHDLLEIAGCPLKYNLYLDYDYLWITDDETIDRTVITCKKYPTGSNGALVTGLEASARLLFSTPAGQYLKTRWFFGFRLRLPTRDLTEFIHSETIVKFYDTSYPEIYHSNDDIAGLFNADEIKAYTSPEHYAYFEVGIDWTADRIDRWIDGYQLPSMDIPVKLTTLDDFRVVFAYTSNDHGTQTTNWTDFYFLTDTGDDTPCERLGPVRVSSLGVNRSVLGDAWSLSEPTLTPVETLNTPVGLDASTHLTPNLKTDPMGQDSLFYTTPPPFRQGDIKALQFTVTAFRDSGSAVSMNATLVSQSDEGSPVTEGSSQAIPLHVGNYHGVRLPIMNAPIAGPGWTPTHVGHHGVKLNTIPLEV